MPLVYRMLVNGANRQPLGDQPVDEVASDEAAGSGDKNEIGSHGVRYEDSGSRWELSRLVDNLDRRPAVQIRRYYPRFVLAEAWLMGQAVLAAKPATSWSID